MNQPKADIISVPASPLRLSSLPISCNRGFTLVELIVVAAILGVLVLLSIPTYAHIQSRARVVRCMQEIRNFEKAITAQAIDKGGVFPATWEQAGMARPLDPWGRPYVISAPFRKDMTFINQDYDLYSTGADGLTAEDGDIADADGKSLDDVLRAGDGGFVGLVESILP